MFLQILIPPKNLKEKLAKESNGYKEVSGSKILLKANQDCLKMYDTFYDYF